jgi:hypothetical protein
MSGRCLKSGTCRAKPVGLSGGLGMAWCPVPGQPEPDDPRARLGSGWAKIVGFVPSRRASGCMAIYTVDVVFRVF